MGFNLHTIEKMVKYQNLGHINHVGRAARTLARCENAADPTRLGPQRHRLERLTPVDFVANRQPDPRAVDR